MFFNAIPLEDELLEEVNAWGKPAMLVVPHHQHMVPCHSDIVTNGAGVALRQAADAL